MDAGVQDGVPEGIAARYLVRLLLEQFRHGIVRTYLYELLDTEIPARGVRDRYGLCRSDFSPKPAFVAVQSLLRLLADDGSKADALDFKVSGGREDLHHSFFENGKGEFFLMMWVEEPGYDVNGRRMLAVPVQQVRVTLPGVMSVETVWFGEDGAVVRVGVQTASSISVAVDDRVTILHLRR